MFCLNLTAVLVHARKRKKETTSLMADDTEKQVLN